MAYSDPAGLNIICSIIDKFIEAKKEINIDYKVFTNQLGIIDKKYSSYIKVISNSIRAVEKEIDEFLPDKIFTATSVNNFEHLWRISSKKKKIRIESFVDHWTGIKKRFFFSNKLVYPDVIFLINNEAKKIALSEGIPEEIIFIKNNPYYEKVRNFKPNISRSSFFNDVKVNPKQKIILYVSDKIKNTSILSDLGFDELSVFEDLMRSLNYLKETKKVKIYNFIIIVKLHPRENKKKYIDIIEKKKYRNIKLVKFYDPLTINYYSDIVIGTFSNMLIESYLLKKPLLRVQIGIKKEDPLGFNLLMNRFISNSIRLNQELEKLLLNS